MRQGGVSKLGVTEDCYGEMSPNIELSLASPPYFLLLLNQLQVMGTEGGQEHKPGEGQLCKRMPGRPRTGSNIPSSWEDMGSLSLKHGMYSTPGL